MTTDKLDLGFRIFDAINVLSLIDKKLENNDIKTVPQEVKREFNNKYFNVIETINLKSDIKNAIMVNGQEMVVALQNYKEDLKKMKMLLSRTGFLPQYRAISKNKYHINDLNFEVC